MFLLHGLFPMKFVFTYNNSLVWWEINFRSSQWSCSVKKVLLKILKILEKTPVPECFEGLRSATLLKKRLWHRCFPVSFARFLRIPVVQNTSGRLLLWKTASKTSNAKHLELIKRRSKVQENNLSCKRALNFDLWKIFSENCKPMRVWLWLVYKFTKNCLIVRLFSKFIQTKKRYPTSLDKIRILTRKLPVISSVLVNLTPKELTPCKIYHICRCAFKRGLKEKVPSNKTYALTKNIYRHLGSWYIESTIYMWFLHCN